MFSLRFRIVLWSVLLVLSLGAFFWLHDGALGFIFLFFLAWNCFSYLRNGTVMVAFYQIKRGNLTKAVQLLEETKIERFLSFKTTCYLYYTQGYIALGNEDIDAAVTCFKEAVKGGLKRHDQVIAYLNLIRLSVKQGRKEAAEEYMRIVTSAYKIPKTLQQDYEKVKLLLAKK